MKGFSSRSKQRFEKINLSSTYVFLSSKYDQKAEEKKTSRRGPEWYKDRRRETPKSLNFLLHDYYAEGLICKQTAHIF